MLRKNKLTLLLVLTLVSLTQLLRAQSLSGKRIYISPSREVTIKFPSVITDFNIQNKESANVFEIKTGNRKNLYIKSNAQDFKSTRLIVRERWNTHIFILQYKETPDAGTDTVFDYSKTKDLSEEASRLKETAVKTQARFSSKITYVKKPRGSVADSALGSTTSANNQVAVDYTELEMKANVAYTLGKLDEAKALYQSALKLQPNADWPAWQLIKIEEKKSAEAAKQYASNCHICYTKYKTTGDSAFNKKAYSLAWSAYSRALSYKSNDRYLVSKLAKIEKLEKDALYTQHMKKGREALISSSLTEATTAFGEALKLRSNDAEAKKGLAEVASRRTVPVNKEEAAKEDLTKLREFSDGVATADQLFQAASYEAAKKAYKEAQQLNPLEPYTHQKIAEIDSMLFVKNQVQDKIKKDSANAVLYARTVAEADKAFEAGDVKKAKALYESARQLRSDGNYAVKRISAIDVILLEEEERRKAAVITQNRVETDRRLYIELLRDGNAAFAAKQYATAKGYFLAALDLRPSEAVPRTQLHLVNTKLEEQRKEERYNYFIRLADSIAYQAGDEVRALGYYDSAHTLKPRDTYAKKQLSFINEQLRRSATKIPEPGKQRKRTDKFNEAVKVYYKADEARIERKYPEAYSGYNAFLGQLDTTNTKLYLMSELYYINKAKDHIQELERYMPQPLQAIMEPAQEDKRRRPGIKNNK